MSTRPRQGINLWNAISTPRDPTRRRSVGEPPSDSSVTMSLPLSYLSRSTGPLVGLSSPLMLSSDVFPVFYLWQGIQDLLICLEMLVAAVFFFYAFPLSDYLRSTHDQSSPSPPRQLQQRGVGGYHSSAEGVTGSERPLLGSKVHVLHLLRCGGGPAFGFVIRSTRASFIFCSVFQVLAVSMMSSTFGGVEASRRGAWSLVCIHPTVVCCSSAWRMHMRIWHVRRSQRTVADTRLVVYSIAGLSRFGKFFWSLVWHGVDDGTCDRSALSDPPTRAISSLVFVLAVCPVLAQPTRGDANTKRKALLGEAGGMPMTFHKSNPRLDLMSHRSAASSSSAQMRPVRHQTRL